MVLINDKIETIRINNIDNNYPKDYIVFDTETTGLFARNDRIIEIGAIKYTNYEEIERFSCLINPGIKLSSKITTITGITNDDLMGQPSIDIVLKNFLDFIEDYPLLAYNAKFDIAFIENECKRTNLPMFENPVIDVLGITRRYLTCLPNHKLVTVKHYLNLDDVPSHRAVGDCFVTNAAYVKCIK